MAGYSGPVRSPLDNNQTPVIKKKSVFDNYDAAVNTNTSDYDRIMQGYRDQTNPNSNIAPISYSGSPDVSSALDLLKNFANTGGYSDSDINSIRERAISPIRSIYSNAQQDLNRQKVISGGYSPGYAGATAKMSRDLASSIGAATTNANAATASMIQSGKLAALSPLANLAESEAGRNLDVSKTNADIMGQNNNRRLSALNSQQSLYGTNPGLTGTLGNQALSAAGMKQNQDQFNTRTAQTNNLAKLTQAGRL